jgi:putative endonuclease
MIKRRQKLNQYRDDLVAKAKSKTTKSKMVGAWAEHLACNFLIEKGLRVRERNYRTRYGEIDLIMQYLDCLIFVEVKYRKNQTFGTAEESITTTKCRRMITAAQAFLVCKGYSSDTRMRFDALLVEPNQGTQTGCTINWIQNILT